MRRRNRRRDKRRRRKKREAERSRGLTEEKLAALIEAAYAETPSPIVTVLVPGELVPDADDPIPVHDEVGGPIVGTATIKDGKATIKLDASRHSGEIIAELSGRSPC